jgi:hypothetical protein
MKPVPWWGERSGFNEKNNAIIGGEGNGGIIYPVADSLVLTFGQQENESFGFVLRIQYYMSKTK